MNRYATMYGTDGVHAGAPRVVEANDVIEAVRLLEVHQNQVYLYEPPQNTPEEKQPTMKRTPNYTTALMAGRKEVINGCECAAFLIDYTLQSIVMPYGTPTLDQWEKLQKDGYTVLDQRAWAITPKDIDLQTAKHYVLSLIKDATIYAVRLKQYGYQVTEARIYSLPLRDHSEILNRKARNCVMLFLSPTEAKAWAEQQGAKQIIFETLNAIP